MSSAKDSFDMAAIQDDLASLKRDLSGLLSHLKNSANQAGRGAVDQIGGEAERLYRTLSEEGRRHAGTISRQVEEQPLTSVLLAFGLGIIASRILLR